MVWRIAFSISPVIAAIAIVLLTGGLGGCSIARYAIDEAIQKGF